MGLARATIGTEVAITGLAAVSCLAGEYALDAKQSDAIASGSGVCRRVSIRARGLGEPHGGGADRGHNRTGCTRRAHCSEEKDGHADGRATGHPGRPDDRECVLHVFRSRWDGVTVAAGFVFCARGGDRFSARAGDESWAFRLGSDATSACPHHVCSMAFAPQPECPAFIASPRRKSVAAPRAKNKTGSHSDTIPTTAKYVKYTFSIIRSPRMSSCAPTGVAIFFFRARCPSRASSAIAATVSPTAVRFAHAPRPNRQTAANPTTTRRNVTLFGVHPILTCQTRHSVHSCNGSHHASSYSCKTLLFNHLQTASPSFPPPRASQIRHLSPICSFPALFPFRVLCV